MLLLFLNFYRWLPVFKGKLRLGKIFFKDQIGHSIPVRFTAHQNVYYQLPNTIESLGVELMINGIYEKKLTSFLKQRIKAGDVYFDIGANIGSIGLPVVKAVPTVKYFGFEASPMVFEYLQINFYNNKVQDYQLVNSLIHEDNARPFKFYESANYGKSSLSPNYTPGYVVLNTVAIDSFCSTQKIPHINWMKIDVQGFELFVFKGMRQMLLDKKVDNILFEFEYWAEEDGVLEKGAAQKYISSLGYELFNLKGEKLTEIMTTGRAMIWAKPANDIKSGDEFQQALSKSHLATNE